MPFFKGKEKEPPVRSGVAALEDTLKIFEEGSYRCGLKSVRLKLSKAEREAATVLLPLEVEALTLPESTPVERCVQGCYNIDTYSLALRRLAEDPREPVLVLNLANPVNPGGGVRRGANAQEEDLCRKSSLLLSLESPAAARYYDYNRSLHTFMGSDAVILTPKVEIIKNERGELLPDSAVVAVLTCAAPMLTYGTEGMDETEYREMVYRRISGILRVAAHFGYRRLVLGAFGCGAFLNDARVVSDLFRQAIDDFEPEKWFRQIDFAVLCRSKTYNFDEFYRNFGADDTDGSDPEGSVLFWSASEKNGYLSNWFSSPFVVEDFEYATVEQYFMAQKARHFHDSKRYTAILKAGTPKECKELGRQVTPFDPTVWETEKCRIMKAALYEKFRQNPALRKRLLATGERRIAEASPYDSEWGIGCSPELAATLPPEQWRGRNLLGELLMEVRAELRAET